MKELNNLVKEFCAKNSNLKQWELELFALKCYNVGRLSKNCKEDKDNPYHIDYLRQTKIEFNGME